MSLTEKHHIHCKFIVTLERVEVNEVNEFVWEMKREFVRIKEK